MMSLKLEPRTNLNCRMKFLRENYLTMSNSNLLKILISLLNKKSLNKNCWQFHKTIFTKMLLKTKLLLEWCKNLYLQDLSPTTGYKNHLVTCTKEIMTSKIKLWTKLQLQIPWTSVFNKDITRQLLLISTSTLSKNNSKRITLTSILQSK